MIVYVYLKQIHNEVETLDKRKLESIMKRYGDTQATLAKHLGISRSCFNKKLNERGNSSFTQPEIAVIVKRYRLSADEIKTIFFSM